MSEQEASVQEMKQIFDEALEIYAERQRSYGNQWKKYGWRGALYSCRRKVERAWAQLWDQDPASAAERADSDVPGSSPGASGADDLLDTINYAAMTIVCVRQGNRDGEGKWW